MNLSELTNNLQSQVEDKAATKQNAAKERWIKVKQDHPSQAKFLELVKEKMGQPKGIKITSGDKLIYGAGKFSPARDFKVVLSQNYSWMDKPRKPKIYGNNYN